MRNVWIEAAFEDEAGDTEDFLHYGFEFAFLFWMRGFEVVVGIQCLARREEYQYKAIGSSEMPCLKEERFQEAVVAG